MSNDLAEIRRFWPKATWWGKNMHAAANGLRGLLWIERVKVGLHRVVYVPENWGRKEFDGPTIAAAMAAAGFAQRPIVGYRSCRLTVDRLKQDLGITRSLVKLQSRQRSRKKVRLGKRKREDAEFDAHFADAMANVVFSNPILNMLQMLGRP